MTERYALHPFFMAAYPILLLYSLNVNDVSVQELLVALGISVVLAALIMAATWPIFRSARKAAVLSSLLMFYFFFVRAGHVELAPAYFGVSRKVVHAILGGVLSCWRR